jgi:hypothetical protein
MHAEIKVGDALIMLGQAGGPWKPLGGAFYLWVENVDEVYAAGPRWRALRPEARLRTSPAGIAMQAFSTRAALRGGSPRLPRVKPAGLRQQG